MPDDPLGKLMEMPRNPARAPGVLEQLIADVTVNPLWDAAKGVGAVASGYGTSPEAGAGLMAAMGLISPGSRIVPVKRELPKWAQEAFDIGRHVRDARENWKRGDLGLNFYEDWSSGRVPKLSKELFDRTSSWDLHDPPRDAFFLSGKHGDDLPEWTTGKRFGDAPSGLRSWNNREQIYEPGVSMSSVDHPRFKDWEWFDSGRNRHRPIRDYEGYLLPMKGSDDEPLMTAIKRIDKKTK